MSRDDHADVSTSNVPLLLDLDDVPGVTVPLPTPGTAERGRRALFEVGVVYRKGPQLYLAVSPSTLITFRAGEPQELQPDTAYAAARPMSVDELCRAWGIPLERLDGVAKKYVTPSASGVAPCPRGSRRKNGVEELVGLVLRRVRIAG